MDNLPDSALREVVIRLQATVETLDKTVSRLLDGMVSREAHEALKDRVTKLDEGTVSNEAHDTLKTRVGKVENVINWVTVTICGTVLLAVLGLVVFQGGGELI